MPARIVASSSDAAYWPSRYSRTYDGTMALPLTALTRSLRTTTPGNKKLILESRLLCCGALASAASFSISLISAPFTSEVEVRCERTLQRVDRLGVDAPLVGVGD